MSMKKLIKETSYIFLFSLLVLSVGYIAVFGIEIEINYWYVGAGLAGVIGFNIVCWTVGYESFKSVIPWGNRRATVQSIGSIFIIMMSALVSLLVAVLSVVMKMIIPALLFSSVYYFTQKGKPAVFEKGFKSFFRWHYKKNKLHNRKAVNFNERDIYWCSVGSNVGYEIDGKGSDFLRPVLVIKKTSDENFVGLPMTSRGKNLPGYFRYKNGFILLEQVRVFNARRLIDRKERMSKRNFSKVMSTLINYLDPLRGPAPSGGLHNKYSNTPKKKQGGYTQSVKGLRDKGGSEVGGDK